MACYRRGAWYQTEALSAHCQASFRQQGYHWTLLLFCSWSALANVWSLLSKPPPWRSFKAGCWAFDGFQAFPSARKQEVKTRGQSCSLVRQAWKKMMEDIKEALQSRSNSYNRDISGDCERVVPAPAWDSIELLWPCQHGEGKPLRSEVSRVEMSCYFLPEAHGPAQRDQETDWSWP